MGVLENWTEELVSEMEEQKEAVKDTIEGDITEPLLALVEERMVVGGAGSTGGEGLATKQSYTFKNMSHMEPPLLLKEVRPAELRS